MIKFFQKTVVPDKELVSTVGVSNFSVLDGKQYNPDKIELETYDKISRHYQVAFSLAIIKYTIQQIDWFVQTDNEEAKKVIEKSIDNIWNRLILSVSKSFKYGFSPTVKVFQVQEIDGKPYFTYKKIKDLDPKLCTVVTDKWGNFDGFLYKKGTLNETRVDPMYAFWYTHDMENGNLYGNSALQKIYQPWWRSEKMHHFANRYYERFGEPLVIGRAPANAKVKTDQGMVNAQKLMDTIIASIRSHSSVHLPSDRNIETKEYLYDIKYLESQMRGFDFETYLARQDKEIALGLFTPELMYGGGSGGSFSLGAIQTQAFYTNLRGIMDNITDYVNLYIIPQLIEYNFGKNVEAKFTYQPLTVDDVTNLFTMITELIKAGKLKPDLKQIEDRSGFKFTEVEPEQAVDQKVDSAKKEVLSKMAEKENEELRLALTALLNE